MKASFVLILLFVSLSLYAQKPTFQDCLGAIPICNLVYEQKDPGKFKGTGNYPAEIIRVGEECIIDEQSGLWYVFNAQTTGILRFTITPGDKKDDYDWDLFDLTHGSCADLATRPHDFLISANCWGEMPGNEDGPTGISSKKSGGKAGNCNGPGTFNGPAWNDDVIVEQGHTYLIYITYALNQDPNAAASNGFKIDFSESEASLFNSSPTKLDYVQSTKVLAGDTMVTFDFNKRVTCASVGTSDFALNVNNKKVDIKTVQSKECLVGSEYAKTFSVVGKAPFEPGEGVLELTGQVDDACQNKSLDNILNFTVNGINIKNEVIDSVKCTSAASGSLTVVAESVADVLYYSIDGGKTFQKGQSVFTGLKAGSYPVVVKNRFNYQVSGTTVEIPDAPKFTASLGQTQSVTPCYGGSNGAFNMTKMNANQSYQISINGGQTFNAYPPNSTISNLSAGTYPVVLKNNLGCESQSLTVVVFQPDPVSVEGSYTPITCHNNKNGSITFTNKSNYPHLMYSIDGGATYSSSASFENLAPGQYSLQAKEPSGCFVSLANYNLTNPSSMLIDSFKQNNIRFDNLKTGGSIKLKASGGEGSLTYLLNGTIGNKTGVFDGIPEGPYYVVITDSLGCSIRTQTYIMRIRAQLATVNTFTPNGDGQNDFWVIKNIEDYANTVVKIYDRWNHLIYQSEAGYPVPWDGTMNGKPLPMDTYYYTIDPGEKFDVLRGFITLVR